jgi:sortase A
MWLMLTHKFRVSRRLIGLIAVALGLALLMQSLWMPAKAELAQMLLARAWQQTLETEQKTPPWPWADHYPVAQLSLPSHQVDQIVLAGDSGAVLAFAPGLNLATVSEDKSAKIISAHRDTHFRFLQHVDIDDPVLLRTLSGESAYRVTDIEVLEDSQFLYPSANPDGLYLVTCYPFDSLDQASNQRLVVSAVPEPRQAEYHL